MVEDVQRAALEGRTGGIADRRAIAIGVIGSLAGTLLMDLVMVAEFSVAGLPATTYLELIGSVVGGGLVAGVVLHLLLGTVLGLVFSLAVLSIDALRIDSAGKGVGLGIAAGLATLPLCVVFALIVRVPPAELLRFSFIPHLVWGILLGAVAGVGLRSTRVPPSM